TSTAKKLRKSSWWIFHGQKDNVVPPELSMDMAEALKKRKAEVKLTIYPEANHNSWDPAFAEKDLIPWLFSKER
ncbi:MAG TPA: prolyl oligopeptidase family serine peptidase, partial [Chitinophagaceae bacterium]